MQNNHASGTQKYYNSKSLYIIKRGKVSVRNVRTFVHNTGRGQLSSE